MTHSSQSNTSTKKGLRRREFLASLTAGAAVTGLGFTALASNTKQPELRVGEGVEEITPPLGIELGGFHRSPGNERRVKGIRQQSYVKAIVLEHRGTRVALVSLDVAGVGHEMASRVRLKISRQSKIPADNVRLCATHTHSTPGFMYLRQWGAISPEYMKHVEKQVVIAVASAVEDLAPAQVSLGKSRADGGNFNRTTKTWKADDVFTGESTHDDRWLDTRLHVLHFERTGDKKDLLWYHFSAHPVCFADELAGPDFPGMVSELLKKSHGLSPAYLQGHAGDVNPGDGSPWRGDAEETTLSVYTAITQAIENKQRLNVDTLVSDRHVHGIPYDISLFKKWLNQYKEAPDECISGQWVDARFAKAWYKDNANRNLKQLTLDRTISTLKLGPLGMVFHPTELYSYYGLSVQQRSPAEDTIVVGYTDGLTGYLTDPTAYATGDYGAFTVPKILDYPPFKPQSASLLSDSMVTSLQKTFNDKQSR